MVLAQLYSAIFLGKVPKLHKIYTTWSNYVSQLFYTPFLLYTFVHYSPKIPDNHMKYINIFLVNLFSIHIVCLLFNSVLY